MKEKSKIVNVGLAISLLALAATWAIKFEPMASAHGHSHAPASAKQLKSPLTLTEANLASGRALYQQHCAMCHGEDGKAKTAKAAAMKVKPIDLTGHFMHELTEGEIYWVITNGIKMSGMPTYKTKLNDQARWQITLYAKTFPAGAAASTPISSASNQPATQAAERRYEMKGKVISVNKPQHQVTIEHGKIVGYMEAMTMPYALNDEKLLDSLKAGDQVSATLVVAASRSWLENVVVAKK